LAVLGKRLFLYTNPMNKKRSILIVEDEQINRELLRIFLESTYQLTFAADFDTAVAYVDSQQFDLIITDIRLGNRLDGIQLLKHISTQGLNKKVQVVAYTASDTSINQKSFAEEGFDGFLSKPANQEEVLMNIAAWLR
jgi:CheY-like chemotaxis protein